MRLLHLLTVVGLVYARDWACAQDIAVGAQAIPIVTGADPTATRSTLTEGYVSQPVVTTHAAWNWFRGIGTLNFEGLTLGRGELNTGGYGEGYVDRRHPHTYLHELLVGAEGSAFGTLGSVFAGRGFAPFGSDDPMARPFEKYPINHHLAQVLERVVAVAAVQRGPVIGEFGVFNGDEPLGPSTPPNFARFGDSWASRLTLLPIAGAELSASIARVHSPEERTGAGLDQHKASVVARVVREDATTAKYALLEWERTNELDRGATITSLGSLLGEATYCRSGVIVAGRIERTDRPEEERLLNPFRSPRPSLDLSNLGVSQWTVVTVSISSPAARAGIFSARPFVELERAGAVPGNPPGLFNADIRYGAQWTWMLTVGARLSAGMRHDRMARYGAALPVGTSETHMHAGESHTMTGGTHDDMPDMPSVLTPHAATSQCTL